VNSGKWTNYLKSKVGFKALGKGEFFISYEDFITHFDVVTICEYKGESLTRQVFSLQNKFQEEQTLFQFEVTHRTRAIFQVS